MTKETIGTEELSATVEKDDKTIQMENGKEVKLNFVDAGDRGDENKEAEEVGVEVKDIHEGGVPTIAEMATNMQHMNEFLMGFTQDAARLNVELSALITVLMRRGVITGEEMQEGINAVLAQITENKKECQACDKEPVKVPDVAK